MRPSVLPIREKLQWYGMKNTGEPVYHAIVWQCRRTSEYCDSLKEKGLTDVFRKKTGLIIDAYFSGTKVKWILDHVRGAREKAERGELLFWNRRNLADMENDKGCCPCDGLFQCFQNAALQYQYSGMGRGYFKGIGYPPVYAAGCEAFQLYLRCGGQQVFFGGEIPIGGAAGDQQSALFGQACFSRGDAKNTYGTGCFLLMNTGEQPVFSENGLVTTIAWGLDGKVNYALEGSVFVAGAVIQWLRDELRLIDSAEDSEYMAQKVKDTNGCYVVPAFTGLGAPYWDQYARGTIVGLTRGVNKCHIIRASLESLAYQVHDVIEAMKADSGMEN